MDNIKTTNTIIIIIELVCGFLTILFIISETVELLSSVDCVSSFEKR